MRVMSVDDDAVEHLRIDRQLVAGEKTNQSGIAMMKLQQRVLIGEVAVQVRTGCIALKR